MNFKQVNNAMAASTFLVKELHGVDAEKISDVLGCDAYAPKSGYGSTSVFKHVSGVIVSVYARDGVFRIGSHTKNHQAIDEMVSLLT